MRSFRLLIPIVTLVVLVAVFVGAAPAGAVDTNPTASHTAPPNTGASPADSDVAPWLVAFAVSTAAGGLWLALFATNPQRVAVGQ